jgi:hypothetical protein
MTKIAQEVRFKLEPEDYRYLKGLAVFYYDHRVIPRPTVHSLAKSATIKAANEWIQQQSIALEARQQRQQTNNTHTDHKT